MLLKLSHISCRKYPKMMYCPKKPKKPKSQRLLRLCLAPPLQESLRFGFFGFFGTVHHFGLVMVINLGQLQQNAWFSKKIQHNCKVQGANPDPTYSYERRAGTVTRLRGIRVLSVRTLARKGSAQSKEYVGFKVFLVFWLLYRIVLYCTVLY